MERISRLETGIQSLYNETKGKSSEDILKIYAKVDKLTPQKHEFERQLAVLQQKNKPKKNDIADSLKKFTSEQLLKIKECSEFQAKGDEALARTHAKALIRQVLEGSLNTVSYKSGKPLSLEHRLNIARQKIYKNSFDFGIN